MEGSGDDPTPDQADLDRKNRTMNSIYTTTSITKPNVESIIQAVSTIIHSQMLEVGTLTLRM